MSFRSQNIGGVQGMKFLIFLLLTCFPLPCLAKITLSVNSSQNAIIVSAGKAVNRIQSIDSDETPQIGGSLSKQIAGIQLLMFDAYIGGNCGNRLYVAADKDKVLTTNEVGDECGGWDYIANGAIGYRGDEFIGLCGMDDSYANWPPYPIVVELNGKKKPYYKISNVIEHLDNQDVLNSFQAFLDYVTNHANLQKIKSAKEKAFCASLPGRTDYRNLYNALQKFRWRPKQRK